MSDHPAGAPDQHHNDNRSSLNRYRLLHNVANSAMSGLGSNSEIANAHDYDELLTPLYHNGMDDKILQIALSLEAFSLQYQTHEFDSLIVKAKIMLIHDDHVNNVNWVLNLPPRLKIMERKLIALRMIPFKSIRLQAIRGGVWEFLAEQVEIARIDGDEITLKAGLRAQALGDKIGSLLEKLGNRVQLSSRPFIEPPIPYMSVFDNRR